MARLLTLNARADRAALIRHLALCAAAATAFLWPSSFHASDEILWLIALIVLLNFGASVLCRWTGRIGLLSALSSFLAVAGWFALGCVTGGAGSPFVAGLWLEILLSAMTFRCAGTLLVTGGAVAALLGEWSLAGPELSPWVLLVQGAFLGTMGGVTALVTCRWQASQEDLARHEDILRARLGALEEELEAARRLGRTGENAARLAHGIKNAVHALRGYATLIQEGGEIRARRRALEGIGVCLNRLDRVSRETLAGGPSPPDPGPADAAVDTGLAIEEVIREVSLAYPQIKWQRRLEEPLPPVAAPAGVIQEALLNLARNAAEAVRGRGEVVIEGRKQGSTVEISVRDEGEGLEEEELRRLFTPGRTTKPDGSGFGLFVTRQLLEGHGGFLRASSARGSGSLFAMGLPLRRF